MKENPKRRYNTFTYTTLKHEYHLALGEFLFTKQERYDCFMHYNKNFDCFFLHNAISSHLELT